VRLVRERVWRRRAFSSKSGSGGW